VTTAALLPTPGDPLLARYWCRNYETWRDQVDELVVLINGDMTSRPIYEAVGARVDVVPVRMGHGEAMRALLHMTSADTVVYVEDDAFVRHPDAVGEKLELASTGVIVGCPRGGMDPTIGLAATEKWGPVTGPDGSTGHGLWPAFLFAPRKALRHTSQRFESWTWQTGETIPGLGYTVPWAMTTDTMTTVAFELRDEHPIILTTNNKEMDQKAYWDAPWFHAGGLSNLPSMAKGGDSNEGRDWAHRFWWWRRIGHDYEHLWNGVDPDYWTPIIEPWINWEDA
jgi:hypothetical protein